MCFGCGLVVSYEFSNFNDSVILGECESIGLIAMRSSYILISEAF